MVTPEVMSETSHVSRPMMAVRCILKGKFREWSTSFIALPLTLPEFKRYDFCLITFSAHGLCIYHHTFRQYGIEGLGLKRLTCLINESS
jgi:hypothetical protein